MKNTFNSWESWQKVATIILSIQAVLISGIFTFQAVTNNSVNTWIERTSKVETRIDNLEKDMNKAEKVINERLVKVEIKLLDDQYIELKRTEAILREERENLARKPQSKQKNLQ